VSDLRRLVLDFRSEELVVHALYRTQTSPGPGPNTKARAREVSELARGGLTAALEALEGRVDVVGTSGFMTREDVLLTTTSRGTAKLVKGAR
jgi:hypothetical protein